MLTVTQPSPSIDETLLVEKDSTQLLIPPSDSKIYISISIELFMEYFF